MYEGGLSMETMGVGEFPVYGALIMLLIDCLLYSLLAVYFTLVIEGSFAVLFCAEFMKANGLNSGNY